MSVDKNFFKKQAAKAGNEANQALKFVNRDADLRKQYNEMSVLQIGDKYSVDPDSVQFGKATLNNGNEVHYLVMGVAGEQHVFPLSKKVVEMREDGSLDLNTLLSLQGRTCWSAVEADGTPSDGAYETFRLGLPGTGIKLELEAAIVEEQIGA